MNNPLDKHLDKSGSMSQAEPESFAFLCMDKSHSMSRKESVEELNKKGLTVLTGEYNGSYGLVTLNGQALDPIESQKVIIHSADGFSWGYGGSGPAQLALAVLLQITEEKIALKNYQDLKWDIIAKLELDSPFEINFDATKYCS